MTLRKAKSSAPRGAKSGKTGPDARYDAAGMGRRLKAWTPASSGPNRAIDGLQRIRDRARDSARNDWAGESGIQKWVTNLIGAGVTPRWKDDAVDALWAKSVPELDADGVLDAYGMQALGVRAWLDGGEVFVRRRPRNVLTSPLAVPLQVQLIEAEFVPLFDALQWQGMPEGNEITQGIERNRYGERVAYWMYRNHPGDKPTGGRPSPFDLIRVPAREVSHVFEPKRPGQMRGVSLLAPVLVKLRASMDFEDVVLDRQKLANLFTLFITRQLPEEWDGLEFDELTGLPKFYSNDGAPMVGLEPGMSQELRPGEDVKFANPPEAGTTYSEYMRTSHMGTAAGAGMPYELMAGDIKDISDRTLRIVVNEFRRFAEQRQYHTVIPRLCQPMVSWWAEAAVLAGKLPMSSLDDAKTPEWAPHGWPDIHPTQDIEGRVKARDAGFTSTSAVIARSGDNPKKVLEERKADEASGLTPPDPKAVAAVPTVDPAQMQEALDATASLRADILAARATQEAALTSSVATLNQTIAAAATDPAPVSLLTEAIEAMRQSLKEATVGAAQVKDLSEAVAAMRSDIAAASAGQAQLASLTQAVEALQASVSEAVSGTAARNVLSAQILTIVGAKRERSA